MFMRMICVVLAAFATLVGLGVAGRMVSSSSDFLVAVGFIGYLAMAAVWCLIARHLYLYARERWGHQGDKLAAVLVLLAASLCSWGCGRTVVEPGHVGIVVNAYGTNKGVQDYPAVTGVIWYNPVSTDVIEYPVYVQNVSWTKDTNEGHPVNEEISFNTGDQMVVYADISLAYQLEAKKAPAFYVKFRADDIETWTHGFLRNLTRQRFDEIAGKYRIEQIMGDNAPFLREVRAAVQRDLEPYGVHIEQLGFNGSPRPPKAVIDAINGKAKATQDAIRVENEVRQAKAEAEKAIVKAGGEAKAAIEKAEGEAKANALVNSSLSTSLLEWRRLNIQEQATARWNGRLPMYSGGPLPMIELPTPK